MSPAPEPSPGTPAGGPSGTPSDPARPAPPAPPAPPSSPPGVLEQRRDERVARTALAAGIVAGVTSLLPVAPLVLAALAVGLALAVRRPGHDHRTARTGAWVGVAGALVNVLLVVVPRFLG